MAQWVQVIFQAVFFMHKKNFECISPSAAQRRSRRTEIKRAKFSFKEMLASLNSFHYSILRMQNYLNCNQHVLKCCAQFQVHSQNKESNAKQDIELWISFLKIPRMWRLGIVPRVWNNEERGPHFSFVSIAPQKAQVFIHFYKHARKIP